MPQDAILGYFYLRNELLAIRRGQPRTMSWVILSRPCGTARWRVLNPGLTSWAILSRPSGTQFGDSGSHAAREARTLQRD